MGEFQSIICLGKYIMRSKPLKKNIIVIYMAFKKYVKKQAKKVVRRARARYTTKTGGARVSKIARDLALVKRQLN
uniref:hypothetical protein n=1 Tax=Limnohabitans sp. TaxID=1907725 RepID=UPI0040477851